MNYDITAKKIIEKEANYILAVKDNQQTLRPEVETACKRYCPIMDVSETENRTKTFLLN